MVYHQNDLIIICQLNVKFVSNNFANFNWNLFLLLNESVRIFLNLNL